MSYKIEIIKKDQQKTSKWSGGTTNEIYIYPSDSLYGQGSFKWRLSSAKIEVEESTFTSLPGISRVIMVIEGELLLKHEGHHNAKLSVFEQDSFSGEWTTTSFGKVIDFNLMLAEGHKGNLETLSYYKGENKDILLYNNSNNPEMFSLITEALYIAKGDIQIHKEINKEIKETIFLSQGDLALITRLEKETKSEIIIHSSAQEESKIIKASIFCYKELKIITNI